MILNGTGAEGVIADAHHSARADTQMGHDMPDPERNADSQTDLPAQELLKFYDELTALNACNAFVTQALAAALLNGGGLDDRSATGGVLCVEWLNERTIELERQLKHIVSQAYASTTAAGS